MDDEAEASRGKHTLEFVVWTNYKHARKYQTLKRTPGEMAG